MNNFASAQWPPDKIINPKTLTKAATRNVWMLTRSSPRGLSSNKKNRKKTKKLYWKLKPRRPLLSVGGMAS